MAEATDPLEALITHPSPPRAGDDWTIFVEAIGNLRYSEWPADLERARLWYEPHLERIHENAERGPSQVPRIDIGARMRGRGGICPAAHRSRAGLGSQICDIARNDRPGAGIHPSRRFQC